MKGFALGLVSNMRVFGTWKWPIAKMATFTITF